MAALVNYSYWVRLLHINIQSWVEIEHDFVMYFILKHFNICAVHMSAIFDFSS